VDGRGLVVHLRDNGKGAKDVKEGIGIVGMRERVEALGGEIAAKNTLQGFELSARIPVEEKKEIV
jgi:signal transduction histidine kinase